MAAALAGCGAVHPTPVRRDTTVRLTPKLTRTLDSTFRAQVNESGIPGASAAIIFPDGREWSLAVGAARLEPRVPMTTGTAFPFDSVSKMATAALALRLTEDGRLDLDDPVLQWYPGWHGDRAATVRDLLGHTSGARDISDAAFARIELSGRRLSVGTAIRAAPRPGARTTDAKYSNTGFEIAAQDPRPRRTSAARARNAPAGLRRGRR